MRHAGEEEWLTFDPGRPISPWKRTNEGRGDGALIRAERNTRTNTSVAKYIRDIFHNTHLLPFWTAYAG